MKAMSCRDGLGILMDYTEGLLPARQKKSVEAHVGGCRHCQGFLRSYLATPRLLREATLEAMPARLGRLLRRRIAALAVSAGAPPRRRR